jgi:hypothetical protein
MDAQQQQTDVGQMDDLTLLEAYLSIIGQRDVALQNLRVLDAELQKRKQLKKEADDGSKSE